LRYFQSKLGFSCSRRTNNKYNFRFQNFFPSALSFSAPALTQEKMRGQQKGK
jgi:hypothetical protein